MKFLFLALLTLPLAAMDFPGTAPGTAIVNQETSAHTLSNQVLTARFIPVGDSLKLAEITRTNGGAIIGENNLFQIIFSNETQLSSSEMTLAAAPELITLTPDKKSPRASDQLPGKALQADFKNSDGSLIMRWRAELRDGSGYLRQTLQLAATSGSHPIKEIVGILGKMENASISGYTDGSIFTNNEFYAGMETPLSKVSFTSENTLAVGNWNPTLVAPKQMTFPVDFPNAGDWAIELEYTSGNHRLDITRVELLNSNSEIISHDEHTGYAGAPSQNNTYNLQVPETGSYTLKVYNTYPASETNSNGTITAKYLSAESQTMQAAWPRNMELKPGTIWKTGTVIGIYQPGQLRRSFLHYIERERSHPYRQFVHYNSWYDLNINRNDNSNPLERMSEAQTLDVVAAWNQHLYLDRGVKLDGFVWDDGWDDFNSLWDFHVGFPNGFTATDRASRNQQAGTGAWLSPWGGYGGSQAQRVAYWNTNHTPKVDKFHLSHPEYYQAFRDRCMDMLNSYDMRYFKFDGIGAGTLATGPAPGNEADIDGLLRLIQELRDQRSDVFINSTVGTWASPFWLLTNDSIWRQGEDAWFSGGGNKREQWITYRDNMIYDRFVKNSPLFPLNSLMFHGLIVGNYPGTYPAQMPLDIQSIKNEIRCAMGCGSGLQELYVTHDLMTEEMWDELAKGIRWLRANADTLADVRWIGGDPEDSGTQQLYGWAAWSKRKGTLTLRNPDAQPQSIILTLAQALELPASAATSYTFRPGYDDQRTISGITGATLAADSEITFTLQPYEVLVFDLWPAGANIPTAPLSASLPNAQSFGAWAASHGIPVNNTPGNWLEEVFVADHNNSGIPNGLKYALNKQNPIIIENVNGDLTIKTPTLPQYIQDTVQIHLQTSTDLENWELQSAHSNPSQSDFITWEIAEKPSAFFRLAASLR